MGNARQDVREAVTAAAQQIRTPLLAVLGAGNMASQALADALLRAKERVSEGTESARKSFEEFPTDAESLREKLDPAQLRKTVDEYAEAALNLYSKLAESGEEAWDKLNSQPQFKKAVEQLDEAVQATQERIDEVLGKVTQRTRSTGEKAANTTTKVASEVADRVEEVGDELAREARSASRKAANKTAPRSAAGTRRPPTKKSSGGTDSVN